MSVIDTEFEALISALTDPITQKPLEHSGPIEVSRGAEGDVHVTQRQGFPERRDNAKTAATIAAALGGHPGVRNIDFTRQVEILGREIVEDDPIPGVKNVILVMSGKGGVGKSTVSANLALGLKTLGARVGLLDADLYGPSVPTLFGINTQPLSNGKQIVPVERHGLALMSIGFLLESPTSAVIWRGPMLQGALVQFLKDVAWGDLDYLILDMPPGTGDIALTLSQRLHSNGSVIVTTPQEVALQDVYKSVSMNQKVGIPILGVVENESYFLCPGCNTRHELFGKGGGAKVAELAETELLAQLPLDPQIREWSDAGTPVVIAAPGSAAAEAFISLAERLARRVWEENANRSGGLQIDRSGGVNRHLPLSR